MAPNKCEFVLGVREACECEVPAPRVVESEIKITRRFIWVMKLRWIWTIIKTDITAQYEDVENG